MMVTNKETNFEKKHSLLQSVIDSIRFYTAMLTAAKCMQ